MQKITRICEICGKQEKVEKTIANPKPEYQIQEVKMKGIGKSMKGLNMDLCTDHHMELLKMVTQWVTKTKPLDGFLPKTDPEKNDDETKNLGA